MFLVTFMYSLFELEISVNFSAKLIIGKSADFSWDFCIYIGRKWFGFWIWDLGCVMGESVDFSGI